MPRPLADYHSLEDGDLNRLWYEEQDPRARDAFLLRWWLGSGEVLADPIAGKDLLAHYHTAFAARCVERGILSEADQVAVYRVAVAALVRDFPGGVIEKFEEVWFPHVDAALDQAVAALPPIAPDAQDDASRRRALDAALDAAGPARATLVAWIERGVIEGSEADVDRAFAALPSVVAALHGSRAARHPLEVAPAPREVHQDKIVGTRHLDVRHLMLSAAGGAVSAVDRKHLEWCAACRERVNGARLVLREARRLEGGAGPELEPVQPEFDGQLQTAFKEVAPEPPKPRATSAKPPAAAARGGASKSAGAASSTSSTGAPSATSGSGGGTKIAIFVALVIVAAVVIWLVLR